MRFTYDNLKALNRSELQSLAGAHGIKKNHKSAKIIELLLEKQNPTDTHIPAEATQSLLPPPAAELQDSPVTPPPPRSPIRSPAPSPRSEPHHLYPELNEENLQIHGGTYDAPRKKRPTASRHSTYTFGTPDSSVPGSPAVVPLAPARLLKNTVDILSIVDVGDRELKKNVVELHHTAAELRKRVADLRAAVRSQKSRRQRIEEYVTYWQNIPRGCSFDDLWSGTILVKREGERWVEPTDEEEENYLKDGGFASAADVAPETGGDEVNEIGGDTVSPDIDPQSNIDKEAAAAPLGNESNAREHQPVKAKRTREENEEGEGRPEDDQRYQPRFRFGPRGGVAPPVASTNTSASSSTDKGKNKIPMNAAMEARPRLPSNLADENQPSAAAAPRMSYMSADEVKCFYGELLPEDPVQNFASEATTQVMPIPRVEERHVNGAQPVVPVAPTRDPRVRPRATKPPSRG